MAYCCGPLFCLPFRLAVMGVCSGMANSPRGHTQAMMAGKRLVRACPVFKSGGKWAGSLARWHARALISLRAASIRWSLAGLWWQRCSPNIGAWESVNGWKGETIPSTPSSSPGAC